MTPMPAGLNATDNHKSLKSEAEKLRRRCMTYTDVCDPNEVKSIEIITSVITEVQNHCRHLVSEVGEKLVGQATMSCDTTTKHQEKDRTRHTFD